MRVEATEVLAWSDRQFLEWLVVTPSDLQLMMRSHAIDTKAQVIQRRRFLVHRGDHEGGDLRARDWRSRYVILREHPPKLIDD
jgi:hypothetical protein